MSRQQDLVRRLSRQFITPLDRLRRRPFGILGPLPPTPACVPPDLFTDCFSPNQGWVHTGGGSVSFDGDRMLLSVPNLGGGNAAHGPVVAPLTLLTTAFRVRLPLNVGLSQVLVGVSDGGGLSILVFRWTNTGALQVITKESGGRLFDGTSPFVVGTSHTVHISLDASSVPTLTIDGVSVPLTPGLFGSVFGTASSVDFNLQNSTGALDVAELDWVIFATGVFPVSTIFCCPDGSPVT